MKKTGHLKSTLFSVHKETGKKRFRPTKVKLVPGPPPKDRDEDEVGIGIVKNSVGITLTYGFQSVRLDVGVEVPWPCRPGHPEDLHKGFQKSDKLITAELEERTPELDEFLKDLAKKYRS